MVDALAYLFAWTVLILCAAYCVYAWRRALKVSGREPNGATTKPVPESPSGRYTSKGLPAALSQADVDALASIQHPYVVGLFSELPEPHTAFPDRDAWLNLARLVLSQATDEASPRLASDLFVREASGEGNESGRGDAKTNVYRTLVDIRTLP